MIEELTEAAREFYGRCLPLCDAEGCKNKFFSVLPNETEKLASKRWDDEDWSYGPYRFFDEAYCGEHRSVYLERLAEVGD